MKWSGVVVVIESKVYSCVYQYNAEATVWCTVGVCVQFLFFCNTTEGFLLSLLAIDLLVQGFANNSIIINVVECDKLVFFILFSKTWS